MNEETKEIELSTWFPTYGLLTSQRILERFNIRLDNDELAAAVKNPRSLYYQLLRVPLKNVFNGIILQQAHDYQVYAQKIFIDYLLSGEGGKDAASPGGTTREDLEQIRTQLIELGEEFNAQELAHQTLISESQASLIKLANELQNALQIASKKIGLVLTNQRIIKEDKKIQQAIRSTMIHFDKIDNDILAVTSPFWERLSKILETDLNNQVRQQLVSVMTTLGDPRNDIESVFAPFLERAEDMGVKLRSYRTQFYTLILSATELIKFLPDYQPDKEKELENRSSLYFDSHIGGD